METKMRARKHLTQLHLKSILRYDIRTGNWFWRIAPCNRVHAGGPAGRLMARGYQQIQINGVQYLAHRLAVLYKTGKWPDDEVDHKHGVEHGDQWSNLRSATKQQNKWNARISKRNTSGFKGVWFNARKNRWIAELQVNFHRIAKSARTAKEAATIRNALAAEHHGKFAK
jgi:HNH endonuclease